MNNFNFVKFEKYIFLKTISFIFMFEEFENLKTF